MKISYRTHPVLEKIHSKQLGKLVCMPNDEISLSELRNSIRTVWGVSAELFGKNVQLITKPFGDAVHLAMPKMTDPLLVSQALHQNTFGTLLWDKHTFCYAIDFIDNQTAITYFHFITTQTGEAALNAFFYFKSDIKIRGVAQTYLAQNGLIDNDPKKTFKYHNTNLIATLNFVRFANVETKDLPAQGRTKEILCKYVNDTKTKIKILDSTWFTNLVKSDAFKVRGHFRLQPKKKDGEWTKELIWINEFQKDGYTRKAGLILENQNL